MTPLNVKRNLKVTVSWPWLFSICSQLFIVVFSGVFAYDKFFHQQIMKKKKEHSYRIFKKVNRLAGPGQFPNAMEYTWGEKPIKVWCSNDYLGMSCHPEVKNAVK